MIVYGIPNCDSVRRARAWLAGQGVAHRFHDFKKDGVPPARLAAWIDELGWQALLNRAGTTWRRLDEAARTQVQDREAAQRLCLAQPSIVRRPVVEWPDGRVSVGFDAAQWAQRLAG